MEVKPWPYRIGDNIFWQQKSIIWNYVSRPTNKNNVTMTNRSARGGKYYHRLITRLERVLHGY